jgi:hypothetical protein
MVGAQPQAEQEAEQFFGDAWRWLSRDGSQQRNVALRAAKLALPGGLGLAGSALGGLAGPAGAGLLGGLGYGAGRYLSGQLPAREFEGEYEGEFEGESALEFEYEGEYEGGSPARRVYADALMEHLGAAAAEAESEQEAEAFIGALIPLAAKLLPMAGKLVSRAVPQLIRGAGQIVRGLRQHPQTQPLVRAMPTVVRRTLGQLARQGHAASPQQAAQVLARQTQRLLASPQQRRMVLQRALAANRRYQGWRQPQFQQSQPPPPNAGRPGWGGWAGRPGGVGAQSAGWWPQQGLPAGQPGPQSGFPGGWPAGQPGFASPGYLGNLAGPSYGAQAAQCCPVCGSPR